MADHIYLFVKRIYFGGSGGGGIRDRRTTDVVVVLLVARCWFSIGQALGSSSSSSRGVHLIISPEQQWRMCGKTKKSLSVYDERP